MHPSVNIPGIADGVDEQVAPLVTLLNKIPNVVTTSSCQGNPGRLDDVEHGFMGHVTVHLGPDWHDFEALGRFMFSDVHSRLKVLEDDVSLSVTMMPEDCGLTGWIYFRNEALPAVTKALEDLAK